MKKLIILLFITCCYKSQNLTNSLKSVKKLKEMMIKIEEGDIIKFRKLLNEYKNNNNNVSINTLVAVKTTSKEEIEELLVHTAVRYASSGGSSEFIELLIMNGADLNIPNKHGNTPLHIAIDLGNKDIFNILLNAGADPFIEDYNGFNAIATAIIEKSDKEIFINILNSLRNFSGEFYYTHNCYKIGKEEYINLIHLIAIHSSNDLDLLKLIIRKGADINKEDQQGNTALYYLIKSLNPSMDETLTKYLKSLNKKIDINERFFLHLQLEEIRKNFPILVTYLNDQNEINHFEKKDILYLTRKIKEHDEDINIDEGKQHILSKISQLEDSGDILNFLANFFSVKWTDKPMLIKLPYDLANRLDSIVVEKMKSILNEGSDQKIKEIEKIYTSFLESDREKKEKLSRVCNVIYQLVSKENISRDDNDNINAISEIISRNDDLEKAFDDILNLFGGKPELNLIDEIDRLLSKNRKDFFSKIIREHYPEMKDLDFKNYIHQASNNLKLNLDNQLNSHDLKNIEISLEAFENIFKEEYTVKKMIELLLKEISKEKLVEKIMQFKNFEISLLDNLREILKEDIDENIIKAFLFDIGYIY